MRHYGWSFFCKDFLMATKGKFVISRKLVVKKGKKWETIRWMKSTIQILMILQAAI